MLALVGAVRVLPCLDTADMSSEGNGVGSGQLISEGRAGAADARAILLILCARLAQRCELRHHAQHAAAKPHSISLHGM